MQYDKESTVQALFKKIILATDFTDASKDASYHAMLQAQTYKAELKALYVFKPRALGISDENYLYLKNVLYRMKTLKRPGSEERIPSKN